MGALVDDVADHDSVCVLRKIVMVPVGRNRSKLNVVVELSVAKTREKTI